MSENIIYNLIEKTLDQFLKLNKFQDYVNRKCSIKCGSHIVYSSQNTTIEEVFNEYRFNDIREDDIVLDIGANVGGFSLFVSKMVKHVYAVEPITTNILKTNIALNNINNITVLEECLEKGNVELNWSNVIKTMQGKSLTELINMCGGHIDFLKMDCEGGEWCIAPSEFKSIRRIEAEIHNIDGSYNFDDYLKILDEAGFKYSYNIQKKTAMIVHATKI